MRSCLLISVLILSLSPAFADTCTKTSYGAGVKLAETTPVSAILDQPAAYAGKEVRVEGEVRAVCEMAGCWMELAADDRGRTLKVKVQDGEMVFPVSARGKRALAEGRVEEISMSRDEYVQFRKHAAGEGGGTFDEATLQGPGPFQVYQLAGTGAEICN